MMMLMLMRACVCVCGWLCEIDKLGLEQSVVDIGILLVVTKERLPAVDMSLAYWRVECARGIIHISHKDNQKSCEDG
jgi:hypothetical protein